MNLSRLESQLGYSFSKPELLERALTHRSWAYENQKEKGIAGSSRTEENESLEFIGDSVLGLVIAEDLFIRHPEAREGDLTVMKHRLVSMSSLAAAAKRLELGEYLRMGRGEIASGGQAKPALLADALEAVIGAVFFDGGYIQARAFVARIFAEELKSATTTGSLDYKTMLQENLQARKLAAPVYSVIATEGMPHERTFFVRAEWNEGAAEGSGRSIKAAEMMAAREALREIDETKRDKRT